MKKIILSILAFCSNSSAEDLILTMDLPKINKKQFVNIYNAKKSTKYIIDDFKLSENFPADIGSKIFQSKNKKTTILLKTKKSPIDKTINASKGINILLHPTESKNLSFTFYDNKNATISESKTFDEPRWHQLIFDFANKNNKFNYTQITKILIENKNDKSLFFTSRIISESNTDISKYPIIKSTLINTNTKSLLKSWTSAKRHHKKSFDPKSFNVFSCNKSIEQSFRDAVKTGVMQGYATKDKVVREFEFNKDTLNQEVFQNIKEKKPHMVFIYTGGKEMTEQRKDKKRIAVWKELLTGIKKQNAIAVIILGPIKTAENKKNTNDFFEYLRKQITEKKGGLEKFKTTPIIDLRHIQTTAKGSFKKGEGQKFERDFAYAFNELIQRLGYEKGKK